jgi:hypothetical protein
MRKTTTRFQGDTLEIQTKARTKKSQSGREKRPLSHATRAHNPSREGSNAVIKLISVQFNHFHPHLNDRSTRTARISNPKIARDPQKEGFSPPYFLYRRTKPRRAILANDAGKNPHARTLKRNVLSSFAPRLEFTARGASLVERVATDTHCYL